MTLTKDEHVTRAMLLGMEYNEICNYYVNVRIKTNGRTYYRLDADTLEKIDLEEVRRRQHLANNNKAANTI